MVTRKSITATISKITEEGSDYYEVKYIGRGEKIWAVADIHSKWRDAKVQRDFILAQAV